MTADASWTPPATPEALNEWVDGFTHTNQPVADADMPPRFDPVLDELVPRSVKLPRRLDRDLQRLADQRGISKSDVIREALEAVVASDAARNGEDVLIPLSAALRALSGIPHQPHSA